MVIAFDEKCEGDLFHSIATTVLDDLIENRDENGDTFIEYCYDGIGHINGFIEESLLQTKLVDFNLSKTQRLTLRLVISRLKRAEEKVNAKRDKFKVYDY